VKEVESVEDGGRVVSESMDMVFRDIKE